MGKLIFIVGPSKHGKSTSLRNLNPKATFIINADGKPLPFKNAYQNYNRENKNYAQVSDLPNIVNILKAANKKTTIDTAVIDTWSRTMTDDVERSSFRSSDGFKKWDKFAAEHYDLLNLINNGLRDNLNVYLLAHPESYYDDNGLLAQRIVTQGKKLERYSPESFSSIVLYTEVQALPNKVPEFYFRTITNGSDTAGSPMGMFEDILIPNDLVLVNKAIKEYYG